MVDEGYIKYKAIWEESPALPAEQIKTLNAYRQRLYALQLIGAYPDGIGYGNISCRASGTAVALGQFIISGSKTGNLPALDERHYALVTKVLPRKNQLYCQGPLLASSESMSHAAIYQACPEVQAVIHVHHLEMWQRLLHQVPTTNADAEYGSPEMVDAIVDLLQQTELRQGRIFVMKGHREGIFTFGESLEAAFALLLSHYKSNDKR